MTPTFESFNIIFTNTPFIYLKYLTSVVKCLTFKKTQF